MSNSNRLSLCCLLWARDGQAAGLQAYEYRVLTLIPEHGGQVAQRVQRISGAAAPTKVQIFRFPSQPSLDSYLSDPRRLALSEERDRVVSRTELFPIDFLA